MSTATLYSMGLSRRAGVEDFMTDKVFIDIIPPTSLRAISLTTVAELQSTLIELSRFEE